MDAAPIGAASKLVGFDGLRAIAVLSVAVFHFVLEVGAYSNLRTLEVFFQLRVGVWIFFVISGFLLYRPYARAHANGAPDPSLVRYATARVLRIWPAYAVALTVLAYVWHRVEFVNAKHFLVHIFLAQNYFQDEITKGLGPAWSLAVELSFYAFLPLFAWAVGRVARGRDAFRVELFGVGLLGVVGVTWQLLAVGDVVLATLLPAFLPTFALGILLAVMVTHRRDFGWGAVARRPWVCWSIAVALLVGKGLIGGADGFSPGFQFVNQLVYGAIALFTVLPAVFGNASAGGNRLLASWPVRSIGVISYGIFLWSTPVIFTVQWNWISTASDTPVRTAVVAVLSFVVTVAIATASWFVVERPALRLKRRIGLNRRRL